VKNFGLLFVSCCTVSVVDCCLTLLFVNCVIFHVTCKNTLMIRLKETGHYDQDCVCERACEYIIYIDLDSKAARGGAQIRSHPHSSPQTFFPSLVLQMLVCDSSSVSKLIYDITSSRGWDSKDGDYGRFFLPLDYSSSSIMVKCCYCYNSNISANPCRTTATPF